MHVSAAALLVSACLCVCVRVCLLVCAYLRSVAFVALFSICCCYQRQSARANLSAAAPEFRWSAHALILSSTRKKKCIAFASPLDAAQSRSTLAFALASLLFPLSKVTEAQPKTCTQFHTHRHTLRPACRCVCVCCTAFCVFCGSPYVCMCVCELRVKKRV